MSNDECCKEAGVLHLAARTQAQPNPSRTNAHKCCQHTWLGADFLESTTILAGGVQGHVTTVEDLAKFL